MSDTVEVIASDQYHFPMYRAWPDASPRGAVLVLQAIVGVNPHIRSVCNRRSSSEPVPARLAREPILARLTGVSA